VAGTVYKNGTSTPNPGVVVRLTSGSGGTGSVLASLTSDASGNFYTSSPIGFSGGVYVSATGTGGATAPMTSAITSGGCNRCHTSANRLIVD
jgi:hypothetical protein